VAGELLPSRPGGHLPLQACKIPIFCEDASLPMKAVSNMSTTRTICKSMLVRLTLALRLFSSSRQPECAPAKPSLPPRRLVAASASTCYCHQYCSVPTSCQRGHVVEQCCQATQQILKPLLSCSLLISSLPPSSTSIHPSASSTSHTCINYHRAFTSEPPNHHSAPPSCITPSASSPWPPWLRLPALTSLSGEFSLHLLTLNPC
jgi:hypothetical protein